MAAIPSTMGTALGTTHGSCLPSAFNSTLSPLKSTVSCFIPIVAGGLNATRNKIFAPLLIPPWIPPELFVKVDKLHDERTGEWQDEEQEEEEEEDEEEEDTEEENISLCFDPLTNNRKKNEVE